MDLPIRKLTVAEHAEREAKRCAETFESCMNPYPVGHPDCAPWQAAFERYLLAFTVPEGEASA